MAWSITDRFPSWGESGEFPVDGFFYEGGDQVNEKHLDALWNGIKGLENDTRNALDDLDSDGDGKVDAADDADTVGGEPPSNFADSGHGNEEHSTDFTTLTEVNNNADVPNADYADSAGDADTVDGEDASAFADTNHGNEEHSADFTTLTEVNNNADVPNADFADDADTVDGLEGAELQSAETSYTGDQTVSTFKNFLDGGSAKTTVVNETGETYVHIDALGEGNADTTVTITVDGSTFQMTDSDDSGIPIGIPTLYGESEVKIEIEPSFGTGIGYSGVILKP